MTMTLLARETIRDKFSAFCGANQSLLRFPAAFLPFVDSFVLHCVKVGQAGRTTDRGIGGAFPFFHSHVPVVAGNIIL